MLIYLNRTGYNGLFRLNRRGAFNVPAGRYTNPKICDAETLRAVAAALRRPGVSVRHASFDRAALTAQPRDFLYFDPPYAPLSATARFTAYTADGFDEAAQVRLHQVMIDLAGRGCQVLLSNSTAPMIHALYGRRNADARAAGLRTVKVPARRAINSRATHRGQVHEYLITNLPSRSRSV
jgi:DNA adenine methylase